MCKIGLDFLLLLFLGIKFCALSGIFGDLVQIVLKVCILGGFGGSKFVNCGYFVVFIR